jgi:hypothetical protein
MLRFVVVAGTGKVILGTMTLADDWLFVVCPPFNVFVRILLSPRVNEQRGEAIWTLYSS